jgi:hypothetical protein
MIVAEQFLFGVQWREYVTCQLVFVRNSLVMIIVLLLEVLVLTKSHSLIARYE